MKILTQGERIKTIRKSLGLTLEKFGAKLGVKKNAISQLENGINNLTDQMAKLICREYNVRYDYLINGEGEMFSDLPKTLLGELCQEYDLDDFDKSILEMYIEFPKEQREYIKSRALQILKKVEATESNDYSDIPDTSKELEKKFPPTNLKILIVMLDNKMQH